MPVNVQKTKVFCRKRFYVDCVLTVCWLYVDWCWLYVDCAVHWNTTASFRWQGWPPACMAFTGNIWLRHCQGVTVRWAQGDSCKHNSAWNISSNVYGKLIAKNLLDLWRVELSYRQCHIADPHLGKLKLSFFVSWKQNPTPPAPPRSPWSKFILNCWQSPLPPNSRLKELTGSNARP